jgi:orotate phosphoribosyltransferase
MDAVQQEVTDIFLRTKALLQGHFVLRSGLHSGHFFQCAQVCQNMPAVERLGALCKMLIDRWQDQSEAIGIKLDVSP